MASSWRKSQQGGSESVRAFNRIHRLVKCILCVRSEREPNGVEFVSSSRHDCNANEAICLYRPGRFTSPIHRKSHKHSKSDVLCSNQGLEPTLIFQSFYFKQNDNSIPLFPDQQTKVLNLFQTPKKYWFISFLFVPSLTCEILEFYFLALAH